MVSVEDIGQGSESIRILGVKWLPRAAAKKSVSAKGNLHDRQSHERDHKRTYGNEEGGDQEDSSTDVNNRPVSKNEQDEKEGQDSSVAPGMEAEEGDFFNLEIAFAYKTSRASRKGRDRAKNMHIYLAFYLPGNIKLRKSCVN